jgi:glycosyltransferase involved in cell wall biosynthesis
LYNADYPKKKIEIVFSYYPSEDHTQKIVEEFKLQHKEEYFDIKVLECRERGLSYGRNLAIQNSSAEYIFLLDDDVAIHRHTFKHAINILASETKVAVVAFPYARPRPNMFERALIFRFAGKVLKAETFPIGCSIVRRKVFHEVGLFNKRLGYPHSVHEELELAARIRKKGYIILVDGRLMQKHLPKKRTYPTFLDCASRLQLLRCAINQLRNYFTRYADSYHLVLSSAPMKWKLELIAYFLIPLPFFIVMLLNFYLGIVYLLGLATSLIIHYRAFKPSFIHLPFIVLLGRVARSYGYVTRRIFLKLFTSRS